MAIKTKTSLQGKKMPGTSLQYIFGPAPTIWVVLTIILLLSFCSNLHAQGLSNSVQKIYVLTKERQKVGTGFFIHPNILATNFHVVKGAKTLYLNNDNNPVYIDTVLAFDKKLDLALLYSPIQGPPLSFSSEPLSIGEKVKTIGYPGGKSLKEPIGMFGGWEKIRKVWHIQIRGHIIPGMSGGPVLNSKGEIVGVNRLGNYRRGFRLKGGILAYYLQDLLQEALSSPSFISLDSFSDKTKSGPKLSIESNHIHITEE